MSSAVGHLILGVFVGVFSRKILRMSYWNKLISKNKLPKKKPNKSLSWQTIKKRMAGITIYTLSNYSHITSGIESELTPELFFLSKSDAEEYYTNLYPDSPIIGLPLHCFFECRHPVKLVPEQSQIVNALELGEGGRQNEFSGIPIFQVPYLSFTNNEGKVFTPLYLRKEDLVKTADNYHDFYECEVFSLEDIIQTMKDSSTSKWNNSFFITPGLTLDAWSRREDFDSLE